VVTVVKGKDASRGYLNKLMRLKSLDTADLFKYLNIYLNLFADKTAEMGFAAENGLESPNSREQWEHCGNETSEVASRT